MANPMKQFRWFLMVPLTLAMAALNAPAWGSSIRDQAGMFSPGAVKAATAQLERFEKATRVPVLIETIDDLSLEAGASQAEKHSAIGKLASARDQESGSRGIFLLISKKDRVISNTLIPRHLTTALPEGVRLDIRNAFGRGVSEHMKAEGRQASEISDQDAGLKSLVTAIEGATDQVIRAMPASRQGRAFPANGAPPVPARRVGNAREGGSGIMTFLWIGIAILAVLFFVRLLGGLFGAGSRPGMGGMPGPGMRGAGYGPGYGGPGYGGGGGGFFSSMMGGIGGALAGNWIYDQMTGRHHSGYNDASSYPTSGDSGGYYSQGDEPIVGGDDGGSGGASWGDSGGGDWGGGDGGGDWGGGGGDWGGGDGGADW